MNTLKMIQNEIATLPLNLRAQVLDFVQFVKQRHGLPQAPAVAPVAPDSGDSPFFLALTDAGFVGCVETTAQLSTNYKSQLDFSAKAGSQR